MLLVPPLEDQVILETVAMMDPVLMFLLQLQVYCGGDVMMGVELLLVRSLMWAAGIIFVWRTAEVWQYHVTLVVSLGDQAILEPISAMKMILLKLLLSLQANQGHYSKMVALLFVVYVKVSFDDRSQEGHDVLMTWKKCPLQNGDMQHSLRWLQ